MAYDSKNGGGGGHKRNHGTETTSAGRDTTIRVDYGRDNSEWCGSKADERGKKMGGGVTNLGHSISGSSAKRGV